MFRVLCLALTILAVTSILPATITIDDVNCNQVIASIDVGGGVYTGTLTITFHDPVTPLTDVGQHLVLTATAVNPSDSGLLSRLPTDTFLMARFPVLITVAAGVDGISYDGSYTMVLETNNLPFSDASPYRLYRASTGQPFRDISVGYGLGSFRIRGTGGSFSEFLIASDLRPGTLRVEDKLQALDDLLSLYQSSIDPAVFVTLSSFLNLAQTSYGNGNFASARAATTSFYNTVVTESGFGIPNSSVDGSTSKAGELMGASGTLRFGLLVIDRDPPLETAYVAEFFDLGNSLKLHARASFEGENSIEIENFNISAAVINPFDTDLLSRLPGSVVIPSEFPVLVTVNPGTAAEQGFRGAWSLELRTENLGMVGDSNLRLFKAANSSSNFEDVSATLGSGSYRVQGGVSTFSEFLIVSDLRGPSVVVILKFTRLQATLNNLANQIDGAILVQLQATYDLAIAAYQAGLLQDAISHLEDLVEQIDDAAGDGIPDTWNSTSGQFSVAAKLSTSTETLRFSVVEEKDRQDPADVNLDGFVNIFDVFFVIGEVF